MQLSIILYIYLLFRILSTWVHRLSYIFHTFRHGPTPAQALASSLQLRIDRTNQRTALLSGLIEYQKAQCFFALTLLGAAIKALLGNGSTFEARSIQELHLTINLLRDVAASAIVCLVFGLYMIHHAGKRAWYTTLLSVVAVGVAGMAWGLTLLPLHNLKWLEAPKRPIEACGGLSPVMFCLDAEVGLEKRLEAVGIGICSMVLTGLVFGPRHRSSELVASEKAAPSFSSSAKSSLNRTKSIVAIRHISIITEAVLLFLTLAALLHLCTSTEMHIVEEEVK
jgi:hypothetical protein